MSTNRLVVWIAVGLAVAAIMFTLVTPAHAVRQDIDGEALTQLQAGGALVVDVRTAGEYSGGHVPNAVNVPMDQLQQTAAGWNKDQPIVVYCATGARSTNAAAYLAAQGFRKVYNLRGGLTSWSGQLVSGSGQGTAVPAGRGTVKTSGKPLFIDFASST